MNKTLSEEDISGFADSYSARKENAIAANAVSSNGIVASSIDSTKERGCLRTFSIDIDAGAVCDQKRTGRCWMFAGLNVTRKIVMDRLNVKNFECSQSYLQFYDKLEKANFFLETIIELHDEPLTNEMNFFALEMLVGDGGHFVMYQNLVKKYGIVPKECFPETKVSSDTNELNTILKNILNKDAYILRSTIEEKGIEEARALKENFLREVYQILAISIGEPIHSFTYEYKDKEKEGNYHKIENITPKEFFDEYVGDAIDEYIGLCDAPVPGWELYTKYYSHFMNNVYGGEEVVFFNIPLSKLKDSVINSLKAGEPVWFAADVSQDSARKDGYLINGLIQTDQLLGIDNSLPKGIALQYRITYCNHAMTFTGVNLGENDVPDRWKVENSWGKENGDAGFFVMDDAWFDNYVYQVVVRKKYVDEEIVKKYEEAEYSEVSCFSPMFNCQY